MNLYGDVFEIPLLTNDGVVIPEIGLKDALRSEKYLNQVLQLLDRIKMK